MCIEIKTPQKVLDIGGLKVGGKPGENPIFMIGTMFYSGHSIVGKRKEGTFDKARAEELLAHHDEMCDRYGISACIDVVANFPEEMEKYIDFVASHCDWPIMIDAWKVPPKLGGAKYAVEAGLKGRVIYNSIAPWSEDLQSEIDTLKELKLSNALLVAFNTEDPSPQGRITLLDQKLIKAAQDAGFTNLLIDTSVLTVPLIAYSMLANHLVKEKYGWPAGCAPSNGSDAWRLPDPENLEKKRSVKKIWGKTVFEGIDSAGHAITAIYYCDFLLYGAIENNAWLFPTCAVADSILATLRYGTEKTLPPSEKHPLAVLFPDFVEQAKSMM